MTPNDKDPVDYAAAVANDTASTAGGKLHDVTGKVRESADAALASAGETLSAAREKAADVLEAAKERAGSAYEVAKEKTGSVYEAAKEKTGSAYEVAKEKTGSAYEGARTYAASTAEATRDRASAAYSSARDTASTARTRAADGIDESPIAAVIGGIAIGVLLGALLPRSQREVETLAPIGDKLATLAKNALAAAKDAGQDTLDELGINKDTAREQVNKLIDGAGKAASSAGSAAAEAIREPR